MDGISVIGRVVDRRYLEGQIGQTHPSRATAPGACGFSP
jgi:hypothetical protein